MTVTMKVCEPTSRIIDPSYKKQANNIRNIQSWLNKKAFKIQKHVKYWAFRRDCWTEKNYS